MSDRVRTVVLYHCPCADGAFAALAVWLNFYTSGSTPQLALVPHSTSIPLSLVELRATYPNARVLNLLDYCGPSTEFIIQACTLFPYVLLIDHHKTACEVVPKEPHAPANFECTLNMTKSACMLAALRYSHAVFSPTTEHANLKALFQYVQDNDLWKHELPDSLAFTAGLASLRLDYDGQRNPGIWETMLALKAKELIELGKPEVARQDARIAELLGKAYWLRTPQGDVLLAVETPSNEYDIRSRLGNVLAATAPPQVAEGCAPVANSMGAVYYESADPESKYWCVSLRSIGTVDTTTLSQRYKGGGHANASGCMILKTEWDSWKV